MTAGLALVVGDLAAQTPEPTPTETEFTIYNVTPGITGFIVFFILAVAGWLLFRSMAKHVRNVDQAKTLEEREASQSPTEEASPGATGATTASGKTDDGAVPGGVTDVEAAQDRVADGERPGAATP